MTFATISRSSTIALLGGVLFANACAAPVDVPAADGGDTGKSAEAESSMSSRKVGGIPIACKCTWFGNQNDCDEGLTEQGPNRCTSKCDCSAGRTCNPGGYCEGIADSERCVCTYGYQRRECNEAVNKDGPNRCSSDCDCAEGRKCGSRGWCEGRAHGPTTCEEQCKSDYDACRQGCRAIIGTKTYCLTICAYTFAQCGDRCAKP